MKFVYLNPNFALPICETLKYSGVKLRVFLNLMKTHGRFSRYPKSKLLIQGKNDSRSTLQLSLSLGGLSKPQSTCFCMWW